MTASGRKGARDGAGRRSRPGAADPAAIAATGSRLKLRRVGIDTYRENVAYLHRECPVYRAEGFQALSKVAVANGSQQILAVLNVVDDPSIVKPDELGLSEQAFEQLKQPTGARVRVGHPDPPASTAALRRKMLGERLSAADYVALVRDITEHRFSKMEIAAFLVASGQSGLDRDELVQLTRAMAASGERVSWSEPLVADKHCIGGIPGNRTSMLVVPIVAAHGILIPKTSSRAITSPAGTADTMEVLAEVDLSTRKLHGIVRRHRGCLAWGGTARLAPADDIIISVERPLGIDYRDQLVASILSKKLAAGSTHLLIDIPVGPTAKVRTMAEAQALRRLFEFVGRNVGLVVECVISDGRQPVGRGIGPVLEARDVMQVLEGHPDAPQDLRQKALRLAGRVIEFDPDVRGGDGFPIARDILDSGRALAKMNEIMDAQGRRKVRPCAGPLVMEVKSPAAGVVAAIDNFHLAHLARFAGAPQEQGAGVDLLRKLGDRVRKGETLYRIHAEHRADFGFAAALARRTSGYVITANSDLPEPVTFEL